jgi:WD40 repeat protein
MNNFNFLKVVERFRRKIKLYENVGEIKVVTKDSGSLGHISKSNFNQKPLKIDVIQNANNKYIAFVDDENKVKIGFNTQLQIERNFVQISDQTYKSIAFHPYNKSLIACLNEDSCVIHVYEISEILGIMNFQLKQTTNSLKGITIFRWNQVKNDLMLIVNDFNTITLWGSSAQKYFGPITTDAPIINADWCLNGELFFVSYGQTIKLFNHESEEFVLSEKRNQYFIILEKDEDFEVSYSLSLGSSKDITKYCMYELNQRVYKYL